MAKAKTTSYILYEDTLPQEFDGFKIAHISDLHSKPAEGIFEAISDSSPDIIAITGDLVHDDNQDYGKVYDLIKKLSGISPVYAVTGNHDLWQVNHKKVISHLEEAGATFLRSQLAKIERGNSEIAIAGADDPFSRLPEVIEKNAKNAVSQIPEYDGFKILLFHRANVFDSIKDFGYDLILSGHMHGGQIRLPLLGGVCAPTSAILSKGGMLFPKYTAGVYNYKNTSMVVNRGVGNTLPIPRFGNPPEVGIITLIAQKETTVLP